MLHLINEIDCDGQTVTTLSTTTNADYISIHDPTPAGAPRMYKLKAKKVIRKLPKDDANTSYQYKYAAFVLHLLNIITGKVHARAVYKKRLFNYEAAIPNSALNADKVADLFVDISLTLDVHPCCLGLLMEPKSIICVPKKCQLRLKLVENIFEYADRNKTAEKTLEAGEHLLPNMIASLRVVPSGQQVRAVVVSEHRNVADAISSVNKEGFPGLEGIMLVLVSR